MVEKTLGIGVITYNRKEILQDCLARILKNTLSKYYLLVADDGSTDGTVQWCKTKRITTITGSNRGVCWNKNRALYSLFTYTECDPILLLEDDCWPTKKGWERDWIEAGLKHHHVGFVYPPWPPDWNRGGAGTPQDPFRSHLMVGQATVTSRESLRQVGFLNTRFQGYGFGHAEWTERFVKAGYLQPDQILCMNCGLEMIDGPTYRNEEDVARNGTLFLELRPAPFVFCPPGTAQSEQQALEEEVVAGLQVHPLVPIERNTFLPFFAQRKEKNGFFSSLLRKVLSTKF